VIAPYQGMWYRARVDAQHGKTYSVSFVDYGNKGDIAAEDVKYLPIPLKKERVVAIPCNLFNVKPSKGVWPDNIIAIMEKLLSRGYVM